MQGINFTSFKTLRRLDLSFCDSKMNSTEIESNVLKFFNLLKEVPYVVIVRLDLPELTLKTFSTILVENFQRENVSDLLEFRVDNFTAISTSTKIFE